MTSSDFGQFSTSSCHPIVGLTPLQPATSCTQQPQNGSILSTYSSATSKESYSSSTTASISSNESTAQNTGTSKATPQQDHRKLLAPLVSGSFTGTGIDRACRVKMNSAEPLLELEPMVATTAQQCGPMQKEPETPQRSLHTATGAIWSQHHDVDSYQASETAQNGFSEYLEERVRLYPDIGLTSVALFAH